MYHRLLPKADNPSHLFSDKEKQEIRKNGTTSNKTEVQNDDRGCEEWGTTTLMNKRGLLSSKEEADHLKLYIHLTLVLLCP